MNQETVALCVILAVAAFSIRRKFFLLPFFAAACFIPSDQRVIIADLDFTVLRILMVVGALRLFLRGEARRINWNRFDRLLLLWVVTGAVVYIAQWLSVKALINRSGVLFDVLGLYWLFRQNIRSAEDMRYVLKTLAWCAIILVPFVVMEWITGRNPFTILGQVTTRIRQGRFRCQASFPHSIMLGLFWATLVPVFIGMAALRRDGILYWAACAAGVFIVFATGSSTPITALVIVIMLVALYRWRIHGRYAVYGLFGGLTGLHLLMKAPVWHLISRINIVGGSTGYHRYKLLDEALAHFGEWAMLGTKSTDHWGRGLSDITNQYILEGVNGGFLTLLLLVILLGLAVRTIWRLSLRAADGKGRFWLWCVCVSMIGHCVAFLGVSYFGQIRLLLYLMLAVVGTLYDLLPAKAVRRQFNTALTQARGYGSINYHC